LAQIVKSSPRPSTRSFSTTTCRIGYSMSEKPRCSTEASFLIPAGPRPRSRALDRGGRNRARCVLPAKPHRDHEMQENRRAPAPCWTRSTLTASLEGGGGADARSAPMVKIAAVGRSTLSARRRPVGSRPSRNTRPR
jgi:hypothetical protein